MAGYEVEGLDVGRCYSVERERREKRRQGLYGVGYLIWLIIMGAWLAIGDW